MTGEVSPLREKHGDLVAGDLVADSNFESVDDSVLLSPAQWQQLPESIQYRSIHYRITGQSEVHTIVTILIDTKRFSAEEIAERYGLRWDDETDIVCWKTTLLRYRIETAVES